MKKRGVIVFYWIVIVLLLVFFLASCALQRGSEKKPAIQPSVEKMSSSEKTTTTTSQDIPPAQQQQEGEIVQIRENLLFEPQTISIPKNTEVSWVLQKTSEDNIRLSSPLFLSDQLHPNDVFSYTFSDQGTYSVAIVNKGKSMTVEVT